MTTLATKRAQWGSNIGFLLAAVGSAVGLGNIWRFPYIAYKNGGSAFLIPYLTALVTAGIPIMLLEFALGHQKKAAAPKAFNRIHPRWEWLGWWSVFFIMFGIMAYYTVVIGWCCNYLVFSFTRAWGSDPNTFFFETFLQKSTGVWDIQGINPNILAGVAVAWSVNWFITFQDINKGIERTVKIMMPVLFCLTAVIIVWSLFLEGADKGLEAYLAIDFSRIGDLDVWVAAYGQIFFTLSLGFGIMIAYASYLPENVNLMRSSVIVGCTNSLYEMVAGIGVFALLGYMACRQDIPVCEAVTSGLGLAFVAYPKAMSMLPFGNLFGVLFFFLLILAGVTSSISIIEAFTSALMDKFDISRKTIVSWVCAAGFCLSMMFTTHAGLFWIDIVDHFINHYGLLTVGLIEAVVVGWFYGTDMLKIHIHNQGDKSDGRMLAFRWKIVNAWGVCIRYITPLALGIAIINSLITEFSKPYEGYPVSGILILGVGCLVLTHIAAVAVARMRWKK
jgi:NSS family neurotransmitter:Na+ symporter